MSVVVGTLVVDLTANTASFVSGLDKAGQQAKNSSDDIKGAFDKIDFSEARGGIALLGEEIGVHLPRHVQTFLAKLPGVATAMSAAFPLLAVTMIGEKIFEAAEKVSHFGDEIRKMQHDFDDAALSLQKFGQSVDMDNLKLEDQINKLQGKPVKNKLLEALEESRKKSEELADSLDKALRKEEELLEKQGVGWMKSFFTGQQGTGGIQDAVVPVMQAIEDARSAERLANAEGRADAEATAQAKKVAAINSLHDVIKAQQDALNANKAMDLVNEQGIIFVDAHDRALAHAKQVIAGTAQANHQEAESMDAVNEKYRTAQGVLNDLRLTLAVYNNELKSVATNGQLTVKAAGIQDAVDVYSQLEQQEKHALDTRLADIAADESATNVAYQKREISAEEWATKEAALAAQAYQAHLDYYNRLEAAAVGSKRSAIEAEKEKFLADERKRLSDETFAVLKKNQDELDKLYEKGFQLQEQFAQQQDNEAIKKAAESNKEMLNFFKVGSDTSSMTAYTQAVLSGTEALREYNVQLQLTEFIKKNPSLTDSQYEQVTEQLRTQADLQDKLTAAQKVHSEESFKDYSREIQQLEQIREELEARGQSELAVGAAIHDVTQAQIKAYDDLLLKQNSVKAGFQVFFNEFTNSGITSAQRVNTAMTSMMNDFNKSFTSFLVTGKGNWAQLATGAVTQMVEMGLQWVETHTLMGAVSKLFHANEVADSTAAQSAKSTTNVAEAMSDAAVAAAGALAYYSSFAPEIAPEMAAAQYEAGMAWAPAAAFRFGGIVPGDGNDGVPALLHPREMVLPERVSNTVMNAVNSGGGSTDSPTAVHHHYSPTINGGLANGEEISARLQAHWERFNRTEMRKRGIRF